MCVLMKVLLTRMNNGFLENIEDDVLKNVDMHNERKCLLSEIFCGKIFTKKKLVGIFCKNPTGNEEVLVDPMWLHKAKFVAEVIFRNCVFLQKALLIIF